MKKFLYLCAWKAWRILKALGINVEPPNTKIRLSTDANGVETWSNGELRFPDA